jgi:excisionase family DNA binding protein
MTTGHTIERICYTPREVEAMTGIPYGTVLSEIRAKRLIARKIGIRYYIHRDRLDEYLKCPDQESQPDSTSAPTPVSGSSATVAETSELAALATLTSQLRKRNLPHT